MELTDVSIKILPTDLTSMLSHNHHTLGLGRTGKDWVMEAQSEEVSSEDVKYMISGSTAVSREVRADLDVCAAHADAHRRWNVPCWC